MKIKLDLIRDKYRISIFVELILQNESLVFQFRPTCGLFLRHVITNSHSPALSLHCSIPMKENKASWWLCYYPALYFYCVSTQTLRPQVHFELDWKKKWESPLILSCKLSKFFILKFLWFCSIEAKCCCCYSLRTLSAICYRQKGPQWKTYCQVLPLGRINWNLFVFTL